MGNRLSKIVTRTGDTGTTGLGDGSRIAKDSLRIAVIGDIDELNSCLGVLLAEPIPEALHKALLAVQNDLFDLGGEICIPGSQMIDVTHIERLEWLVSQFNDPLPPLKEFILPGGTRAAALAHLARTVCRRAERSLVHLGNHGTPVAAAEPDLSGGDTGGESVSSLARQYLNRLSDLLFVVGRSLTLDSGCGDVLWRRERR